MPDPTITAAGWTALQAEIATDPAKLGYAGLTAPAIAELLNTPGNLLPTPQPWTKPAPAVPIGQVIQWCATADGSTPGPIAAITDASANASDPARAACLSALRIFGSSPTFDVSDPTNLALLRGLVTAGKVTSNQEAALLSLGTTPASRAEQLWGPDVVITPDQVHRVGF